MAKYEIPMKCEQYAYVVVEADSLHEAIQAAEDKGLPALVFREDDERPVKGMWRADMNAPQGVAVRALGMRLPIGDLRGRFKTEAEIVTAINEILAGSEYQATLTTQNKEN